MPKKLDSLPSRSASFSKIGWVVARSTQTFKTEEHLKKLGIIFANHTITHSKRLTVIFLVYVVGFLIFLS
jgi:hypothetical protein